MVDENLNNKIHILPEFIANQIAAGEVVQRPESVVKELVENALDAEATTIAIFIVDAGKSLIHVVDNGIGMSKDDLALAPLRHATSKIYTTDDLAEIKTFGFRGEAIPSISSVALLEIRTKKKTGYGWKLISEPMKNFEIEQVSMETGTQIFVRNLFYNVPARRKFLKTNSTEQKYIYETIQKFALAHPDKRFLFYDNNALVFDVKPEKLESRIKSILRVNDIPNTETPLIAVDMTINDIQVSGFIGQPQLARKINPIQYFFLNKRNIISKNLAYAVYSGFEHLIEKKLKPFFILNISLDFKSVDVNVHPQKSEVKFEDEQLIYSCVKKSVVDALRLHNLIPELVGDSPTNITSYEEVKITNEQGKEEILLVDKISGEVVNPKKFENPHYNRFFGRNSSNNNSFYNSNSKMSADKTYYANKNYINPNYINTRTNESLQAIYKHGTQDNSNIQEIAVKEQNSNYEIFSKKLLNDTILSNLWQVHNKYIFMYTESGILAIDQHNAHERYLYEKLVTQISTGIAAKQNLLFPIQINLNSLQMLTIKEIESELEKIGFDFEIEKSKNSNNTITIASQPANLDIGAAEVSFVEIVDDYLQNEELTHTNKQERIAATVACKSAIKAGRKLSQEEMKSIVVNLMNCKMQHVCPHGRPIIVYSPIDEWDKKFGRK